MSFKPKKKAWHRAVFKFVFLFMICGAFSAVQVNAKSVAEYRKHLAAARQLLEELLTIESGGSLSKDDVRRESEIIEKIKKELPATTVIESSGASVETSNQWLDELFSQSSGTDDSVRRVVIFTEIDERLAAVDSKLAEVEKAASVPSQKDEDKQKLAGILRRDEFQEPPPPEKSRLRKLIDDFFEWLVKNFPKAPEMSKETSSNAALQFVFQIIIFAALLCVIGFVVFKFAPYFLGRINPRSKKQKRERVVLGETIASDVLPENLFSEAEKLAREGDLRGAIRKGYIAVLCELSDRKIISLSRNKTNRDYLRDVAVRGELYANMNGLTQNFERTWYGAEQAGRDDWEHFCEDYNRTIGAARG